MTKVIFECPRCGELHETEFAKRVDFTYLPLTKQLICDKCGEIIYINEPLVRDKKQDWEYNENWRKTW